MDMDEIIKILQEDAAVGFELLVKRFENRIFKKIRLYISDYELAKDVCQKVFKTLWSNHDKLQEKKDPYLWMIAVAKNQSLKALRDEREGFKDSIEIMSNMCGSDDADRNLKYEELVEVLKNTNVLRFREKEILLAVDVDGMSIEEAAEMCCLSPQTIRNVLHLARGKARILLGQRK